MLCGRGEEGEEGGEGGGVGGAVVRGKQKREKKGGRE